MKHRDCNVTEGWIGAPQAGKTENMVASAIKWQKETHGYVIVHDIGWKIPPVLHDGTNVPLLRHVDENEARKSIARMKGPAIHSISSDDARLTIQLAKDVAQASLARFKDPPPVLLVFDEIATSELADKGHLDRDLRKLITSRRHEHIAVYWGVQHLRFVNNGLVALSTKMHIARMLDEYSEDRLISCGVQPEDAAKVKHLAQYQFHDCFVS